MFDLFAPREKTPTIYFKYAIYSFSLKIIPLEMIKDFEYFLTYCTFEIFSLPLKRNIQQISINFHNFWGNWTCYFHTWNGNCRHSQFFIDYIMSVPCCSGDRKENKLLASKSFFELSCWKVFNFAKFHQKIGKFVTEFDEIHSK